jgi:uridine kinase
MALSAPQPIEIRTQLDSVIDQIHAFDPSCENPMVVGVCGGTSTGKSTVVTQTLQQVFKGKTVTIGQDHFQFLDVKRDELDPVYGLDHPHHYGVDTCIELTKALKAGEGITMPEYDFKLRKQVGIQKLKPKPIIIVEGLYAGFGSLKEQTDLLVYTQSSAFERMTRRIIRNQYERYPGQTINGNRAILSFLSRVQQAHVDFVRPQQEYATQILNNPIRFGWLVDKHSIPVVEPFTDLDFELKWEQNFRCCQCSFRIMVRTNQPNDQIFSIHWGELPYFRTRIRPETASRIESFDWHSQ